MLGYNWRSMTSLVALLTLGLLWPVSVVLVADSHVGGDPNADLCQWGCLCWETVNGKRQGRGSTRIKTADATREPGKTISARARGR